MQVLPKQARLENIALFCKTNAGFFGAVYWVLRYAG